MIYGTPPYRIEDDQTDRIGIRTLVISKAWHPPQPNMSKAELLDASPEPPPDVPGGVRLIGRQLRPQGGVLRTYWTFDGIDGDGKSVTFKGRHNTEDYGFDPGFSQASIIMHPNFAFLRDEYGGVVIDGQVEWPPLIGGGGGFGAGLGATSKGAEQPNPLYGYQDYLRFDGIYKCRYVAVDLRALDNTAGAILPSSALPGVAPVFSGRNWLMGMPSYHRRGPVYEIIEYFWLSGPGGWPRPIYGVRSQR